MNTEIWKTCASFFMRSMSGFSTAHNKRGASSTLSLGTAAHRSRWVARKGPLPCRTQQARCHVLQSLDNRYADRTFRAMKRITSDAKALLNHIIRIWAPAVPGVFAFAISLAVDSTLVVLLSSSWIISAAVVGYANSPGTSSPHGTPARARSD